MTFSQRTRRLALGGAGILVLALAAVPALAAAQAVSIQDKTFQPAAITVAAGDTVTWTVTKSIGEPHSVTSGKPGDADAGKQFDSGITLKDNGQSYQFTFNTPGTYNYYCSVHANEMTGVVTVTEAQGTAAPSATAGSAAPSPTASAAAGSPAPSGGPGPSAEPEVHEPVPVENRVIAAGVLIGALALLFAANVVWRRVNRA